MPTDSLRHIRLKKDGTAPGGGRTKYPVAMKLKSENRDMIQEDLQ
jgi:hypothetical protein